MRRLKLKLSARIGVTLVAIGLALMCPLSSSAQKRKPVPSQPPGQPVKDTPANTGGNPRSFEQAQLEMSILMSRRTLTTDQERERNRLAAQLLRDLQQLERLNTENIVPFHHPRHLITKKLRRLVMR